MVNGVVVLEGWRCGVKGVVLKSRMKIGEGQRVREDQWHGTKGVGVGLNWAWQGGDGDVG